MNYSNETLKNALSSEYVLGTLSGRARIRYKRLLMEQDSLQKNVWQWEKQLNQLGTVIPEVKPDAIVWEKIQQRLGFTESSVEVKAWWQNWLPPALLASVVLMGAIFMIWQNTQQPLEPVTQRVAVVQNANAEALWLIEIKEDNLRLQATAKLTQYSDKDYQLWMIAKDGRPPIPLGLLPQNGSLEIVRSDLFDQVDIAALAVSLEPLGGSPNGQPTTVLYTTELVTL